MSVKQIEVSESRPLTVHRYLPSGWCVCGHHRDDGHRQAHPAERPTVAEIRSILGPTYQPKNGTPA